MKASESPNLCSVCKNANVEVGSHCPVCGAFYVNSWRAYGMGPARNWGFGLAFVACAVVMVAGSFLAGAAFASVLLLELFKYRSKRRERMVWSRFLADDVSE